MIRRFHAGTAVALVAISASGPALAELAAGDPAPDFSTTAYLAGESMQFHLADALRKGPVVLYFFPAAHTAGCNVEAHLFSEAADEIRARGATLIGITAGNIDELADFSRETEHCAGKFPVAADPGAKIATDYDALWTFRPGWSDRTSYVIGTDGQILHVYQNLDPKHHVKETLEALPKIDAEAG